MENKNNRPEIKPPKSNPTNEEIFEWLKDPKSHPELEEWFQQNKDKFQY